MAEHALTGHKVAIKILNRKRIKAMDMDEKGACCCAVCDAEGPRSRCHWCLAVRREIKILRLFMHPHIIRLYEVVETPTDIFVVMEYVKAGELFDYIVEKGRLGENEARHFFQQIISGVEYCHRNMVVHRDLKPENLLLDSRSNVKIADFGLSNVMRDGHFLRTSCGSPNYAAPEVISGRLYAGPEVDVWSCGVILYALLCGSLPFDDESIPNLFKKIKGGIYTLPSHLSPGARDLIARTLLVDPLKRITIPEIRAHPWFMLHLPRYLAVPPPDTAAQAAKVDPESLDAVVAMGFDRAAVVEALRRQIRNKATVAYYLICDNKRNGGVTGYLGAEFDEVGPPGSGGGDTGLGAPGTGTPLGARRPSNVAQALLQQRITALQQAWQLGVVTKAHPGDCVAEVHRALQQLGIRWKRLGSGGYTLRCMVVPPPGAGQGHLHLGGGVKFEVQLYRLKEERYAVDIQRTDGDLMLFLDVSAALLAELRLP